jgi:hypothetical protein
VLEPHASPEELAFEELVFEALAFGDLQLLVFYRARVKGWHASSFSSRFRLSIELPAPSSP